MNPVQEAGKITLSFMDSMKREPMALALCVLSFALIGLLYFQSHGFTEQRRENVKMFIEVQREVQKLLSQCIVPAPEHTRPGQRSMLELPQPSLPLIYKDDK